MKAAMRCERVRGGMRTNDDPTVLGHTTDIEANDLTTLEFAPELALGRLFDRLTVIAVLSAGSKRRDVRSTCWPRPYPTLA